MGWFHKSPPQPDPHTSLAIVQQLFGMVEMDMQTLLQKVLHMSQNLDALIARVDANGNVINSLVELINGLRSEIIAAGTDPDALKALTDKLAAQDEIAAAVMNQDGPKPAPAPVEAPADAPADAPAADPAPAA